MKSIETMLAEIPDMADEAWRTKGTKVVSSDGHRGRSVPGSRCLADLDRMLALLPTGQAQAITLVKIEGASIAEASQICGQSESLVKVNIHRGLKKLAQLIESE